MITVYILIAVILISVFLILLSKINFFVEYKKYPGEKLYTDMKLSIGFVNLSGLIKPGVMSSGKKKSPSSPEEEKDKKLVTKLQSFAKAMEILKALYCEAGRYNKKILVVENLDFHLKFGLFDAAQTGIATGAIWTILYSALAVADHLGTVKKHFFEVVPVFTEAGFMSQGKIKVSVRVINALSLAARLYLTYRKVLKEHN